MLMSFRSLGDSLLLVAQDSATVLSSNSLSPCDTEAQVLTVRRGSRLYYEVVRDDVIVIWNKLVFDKACDRWRSLHLRTHSCCRLNCLKQKSFHKSYWTRTRNPICTSSHQSWTCLLHSCKYMTHILELISPRPQCTRRSINSTNVWTTITSIPRHWTMSRLRFLLTASKNWKSRYLVY